jgi:hypothetical protein
VITIEDFLRTVDYKITDGDPYLWSCYGPNVRSLDYWNGSHSNSVSMSIEFDTKDQTVYEMQVWDGANEREYRWIHPNYVKAHKKESKARGVKRRQSIDDRKFIDIDVEEDILSKARAIYLGEDYDTRLIVPLELNDDELFQMMKLAHERDVTLNQLVEQILTEEIARRS